MNKKEIIQKKISEIQALLEPGEEIFFNQKTCSMSLKYTGKDLINPYPGIKSKMPASKGGYSAFNNFGKGKNPKPKFGFEKYQVFLAISSPEISVKNTVFLWGKRYFLVQFSESEILYLSENKKLVMVEKDGILYSVK